MKKTYYSIILIFISIFTVSAQIPQGYYDAAEGKIGDELKLALNNIIKGHVEKTYGEARYILEESDLAIGSTDSLRTLYTYHKVLAEWDSGETWNREHVWSKSRGFDVDVNNSHHGIGSDLHNLRACVTSVNSAKNNRWFAQCDEPYNFNGDFTGSYTNTSGGDENWLWEPRDEDKGDVARIIFYMVTRYEGNDGEADLEMVDYIPEDKYTTDPIYALFSDLMQWHIDDPVDDFELYRNNVIYQYQNNRNPFIDHPEYVSLLFGTTITNVAIMPAIPFAGEEVEVSANVNSQNALDSVVLKWGLSDDDLNNIILMTLSEGNTYTTDEKIPGQTAGTVYYLIEATDSSGVKYSTDAFHYTIAVEALFSENFETTTNNEDVSLDGWANINEVGERKWIGKEYDGNKYAQFTSYNSGSENTGWLVLPAFNLDETANETFTFDVNIGYWEHDALSILLSNDFDGQDVLSATWQDISEFFTIPQEPTDGYGTFVSAGNMDLSAFNGMANIAFKYNGSDPDETTTLQIDNVVLSGDTVSVAIMDRLKLALYPNPTSNSLNLGHEFVNANLKIFNVLGVELANYVFSGAMVDVAHLKNGQYFIQIIDNKATYSQQFMIVK